MNISKKKFIALFIISGFAFLFITTSLLGSTGVSGFPQSPDTLLGTVAPEEWKHTISILISPIKIILIGPLLLPSIDILKEDPPPPLVGIYFIIYWTLLASLLYSFFNKKWGSEKSMSKPKNWIEYFEKIEERPGMFFGRPSIRALQFEIQGFHEAEILYNIPKQDCLSGFSFQKFEEWVYKKYNNENLGILSFTLAQYINTTDKEKFFTSNNASIEDTPEAFRTWFQWYHEFIKIDNIL